MNSGAFSWIKHVSDKCKRSAVMAYQVLVPYLSFTVIEMRLNFTEFYFFYYQAVTSEHPKVVQSMFWIIIYFPGFLGPGGKILGGGTHTVATNPISLLIFMVLHFLLPLLWNSPAVLITRSCVLDHKHVKQFLKTPFYN